jgi:hypothetical protein
VLHSYNLLRRARPLMMPRFGQEQPGPAKVASVPSEQSHTTRRMPLSARNDPHATWTANVTVGWLIF